MKTRTQRRNEWKETWQDFNEIKPLNSTRAERRRAWKKEWENFTK
jgi:hypothetical protein